ncbi:MAG: DedA family protein [Bauldia sp.]|nr:DedA family protein [Bauldia sp.]
MASTYVSDLANIVISHGAPFVFLAVALEALGLPLPGETLVVAVGAAIGVRGADIVFWFFVIWTGAFLGDNVGYLIGRRFGRQAIARLGQRLGISDERIDGFEQTFNRYGPFIVVIARFIVPLRQLNGLIAGSMRMPWLHFALANAVGAAIWVGVWLFLSSRLATLLRHLDKAHGIGIAAMVLAAIVVSVLVVMRIRHVRKARDASNRRG